MPRNKGFCAVCQPLKWGIVEDFQATFGIFKRQISDKLRCTASGNDGQAEHEPACFHF